MATKSAKQEFKELLEYLNKEKGVSLVAISKETGIPIHKLKNINTGRSSGNEEMLEALKDAYGNFSDQAVSDFQSEIEEKDKEIERLKKLIIEQRARIDKMIDLMYDKEKGKEE